MAYRSIQIDLKINKINELFIEHKSKESKCMNVSERILANKEHR